MRVPVQGSRIHIEVRSAYAYSAVYGQFDGGGRTHSISRKTRDSLVFPCQWCTHMKRFVHAGVQLCGFSTTAEVLQLCMPSCFNLRGICFFFRGEGSFLRPLDGVNTVPGDI